MGMGSREHYIRAIRDHASALGEPLTKGEEETLPKLLRSALAKELRYLQARALRLGVRVY